MGLLDGLLGQVLNGMAQGGQRPSPGMGGLGDLLNQMGGMGGMPGMPGGGMPGMGPRGAPAPSQAGMGGLGGAALGALVMMALQMLQKNGGLGGVLGRMQQEGHGREADSWVSSGPNMPISPDVLSQIFGREEIGRMAEQAGMSPDEAAGGLASIFPDIVNEITPQGRVEPGSDDAVTRALEILERNQRRA
jgi:uncharacterized protein YidB (DUF937 family)